MSAEPAEALGAAGPGDPTAAPTGDRHEQVPDDHAPADPRPDAPETVDTAVTAGAAPPRPGRVLHLVPTDRAPAGTDRRTPAPEAPDAPAPATPAPTPASPEAPSAYRPTALVPPITVPPPAAPAPAGTEQPGPAEIAAPPVSPAPPTTTVAAPETTVIPAVTPDTDVTPPVAPERPRPRPRHARDAPAPQGPATRPEVALAGEAVRAIWSRLDDLDAEIAHWFAALLFSLAPGLRAHFPAQADPAARRLLVAAVGAMCAVDRPEGPTDAVTPLARELRSLQLDAGADEPIGVALVGAVREFAGELWTCGADDAWVRAYSLAAEPARAQVARLPGVVGATVVGHRRLTWDLAVITVAPDAPVAYRAGQSVTVEAPARPRMWRSLTPAGAPRADGLLEFHVRAVTGGWVSRSLVAHSRHGERWRIGPAEGGPVVDPSTGRELLLAVGGTGASVALAVCEDLAAHAAAGAAVRPTTVVVGGRTPEDLHVLDRFADLADAAEWLAVVGVCESDPLDTDLAPGTVADTLARSGPWAEHDVVVAGSPDMVRATVAVLAADGVPPERIHHDPLP